MSQVRNFRRISLNRYRRAGRFAHRVLRALSQPLPHGRVWRSCVTHRLRRRS